MDSAGPFWLRSSRLRSHNTYKAHIAVFVCMSTKAVHLEAVCGYDSDLFIAAFSRFMSRRGLCSKLYSDQGTTFVGADTELRRMYRKGTEFCRDVIRHVGREGMQWKHNFPAVPHFGRIWEAVVKSVKHHIKRVVGETKLTFEEMSTLLCRIEACIISRPLLHLSDDHFDLSVLIPANFLIGEESYLFIEPHITEDHVPPLQRW